MPGRIALLLATASDSFWFGCVDGFVQIGGIRIFRMATLFALCDGLALWLGTSISPTQHPTLQLVLLPACIVFALLLRPGGVIRRFQEYSPSFFYVVPVVLCIDNFLAGRVLAAEKGFTELALAGATSGPMFLLGELVGRRIRRFLRSPELPLMDLRRDPLNPTGLWQSPEVRMQR
jgi:hypothetical protein